MTERQRLKGAHWTARINESGVRFYDQEFLLEASLVATVYHITTEHQWHDTQGQKQYEAESFQSEGFIHCSDANQVVRVANHLFKNIRGLKLLHIKTELLRSRLVYENLEGGEELFPHVYGPINLDAIVSVSSFEPGADGTFDHAVDNLELAELAE
jgi:uncharacterized protein (DUF952 family)